MSASRFEPEGLSIIDAGQAPEIFATGMEVQIEADHVCLRWYRDKHESGCRGLVKILVAEIIVSHAAASILGRQLDVVEVAKAAHLRMAS